MIKNPTFGSDSEIIIEDLSGRPFPVCGMLGGTKENPRKLGNSKYYIQEDNVLLEYNTPVFTDISAFCESVVAGATRALQELPPTLRAYLGSTAVYDENFSRIPQVMVFGCDPDFNAYTLQQNPRPINEKEPMLRSAAGHIHIGWEGVTKEDQVSLVKACDLFLGLPSVLFSDDRKRRTLYGKAGTFRPKEYGIEYRVLDNYWIFSNHAALGIASGLLNAIKFVNAKKTIAPGDEALIQDAINNYKTEEANELWKKYDRVLRAKTENVPF